MIFYKQGATIGKFHFYFQGQEMEIVKQYTQLGFTFIPSGEKHQGIENLINKVKNSWLRLQRFLQKSEEISVNTYLNLIDTTIKRATAFKSWWDSKDQHNLSKIEKFHLSLCKQILGVKITQAIQKCQENQVDFLSELPLKYNCSNIYREYLLRKKTTTYAKLLMRNQLTKNQGWCKNETLAGLLQYV